MSERCFFSRSRRSLIPGDAGGPAGLGRWRGGLGEQGGEPYGRGLPVAPLRPVLGRADADDAVDEPPGELGEGALLPDRGQRLGLREVEPQLDLRVTGVDVLSAGPAGARETPQELGLGEETEPRMT